LQGGFCADAPLFLKKGVASLLCPLFFLLLFRKKKTFAHSTAYFSISVK
jgi:hypothetical protein